MVKKGFLASEYRKNLFPNHKIMVNKKQTWVSPRNDEWIVQHENSKRATKIFDTQKEAINYGRQLSKGMETEFIVQSKKGTIRIKDSHGSDSENTIG